MTPACRHCEASACCALQHGVTWRHGDYLPPLRRIRARRLRYKFVCMPLMSMALVTIHLDAAEDKDQPAVRPVSHIETATNATCMDAPAAVVRKKAAEYDRVIASCAQVWRSPAVRPFRPTRLRATKIARCGGVYRWRRSGCAFTRWPRQDAARRAQGSSQQKPMWCTASSSASHPRPVNQSAPQVA